MNIMQAKENARWYMRAKKPVFWWGGSGIGKSQAAHQLAAEEEDCGIWEERLSLYESVDMRGLPSNVGGNVVWSVPHMFQEVRKLAAKHARVILFLDELNTSSKSVLVTAMQLCLSHRIGPHELPANVWIIAAGNRAADRAAVTSMPHPLEARFAHQDIEADAGTWRAWAEQPGHCAPIVCAFVQFRPNLIYAFNPSERANPNPRAWISASDIIQTGAPRALLPSLLSGVVGKSATDELLAFVDVQQHVPKLADIVRDPQGTPVPPMDQPGLIFATAVQCAKGATRGNFPAIIDYLERMPEDVSVMAIVDATKRDKTLMQLPAFIGWTTRHQDIAL